MENSSVVLQMEGGGCEVTKSTVVWCAAGASDQLRAFNVSKSKSAGDLIAELKAHSGVASLRKVGLRSTGSTQHHDDDQAETTTRQRRPLTTDDS